MYPLCSGGDIELIVASQTTFRLLTLKPGIFPSLRSIAYNHGGLWGSYSRRAERWYLRVVALGHARPLFSSWICGTSRWDRDGQTWVFTRQMDVKELDWLR